MPPLSSIPVGFVAGLHVYIMALEMFFWTKPRAMKAFGTKLEYAKQTQVLAANQGLYNGFLAAGLGWGLAHPIAYFGDQIQLFFLGCVAVAGVYGGITVKPKIMLIQTLPATIGMLAVCFF
ncbi:hypothetical protein HYFRA_00004803 [Hymenoscyphus fraxineus]|uniref:DUF1304-domain-containing protein n=1 Tax=Hymenoscyphus fraxineus TaxID=746836 RepID=A0A9N9KK88_9HELO|nr:hypothetical protein HYFRA_00004803 [Hymenoscyphus fraxineus]